MPARDHAAPTVPFQPSPNITPALDQGSPYFLQGLRVTSYCTDSDLTLKEADTATVSFYCNSQSTHWLVSLNDTSNSGQNTNTAAVIDVCQERFKQLNENLLLALRILVPF